MISDTKYLIAYEDCKETEVLNKGIWLMVLKASRIPPHLGLMIDGNYNSLTVRGLELNISAETILKTISQKKIETLFLKVKEHAVFTYDQQLKIYQEQLNQFTAVKANEATCLSPLKLFFCEFYAINSNKEQLFFDFVDELYHNACISGALALNIVSKDQNNVFTLPHYTNDDLQEIIEQKQKTIYKQ